MTTQGTDPNERVMDELILDSDWLAWPGMHGGYVMAISGRAAAGLSGGDLPVRAMSTRLLRALEPRRVQVQAILEHSSRSTVTVSVRLLQDGQTAAMSVCTFAAPGGVITHEATPAPVVPVPDERHIYRDAELLFPFARKLEIRPATPALPLAGGEDAELTAWLRLREADLSLESMLILADAMPPAIYATLTIPIPVPSIDIAVHFAEPIPKDEPFSGWLLAQQRNVRTAGGISIDECDLWDQDGRLIAQTRQLRRVIEWAAFAQQP